MSFAVVKFLDDNEEDVEIVSEVPISWLFKNNTMCRWPQDKYASIYISKSFQPLDDWQEYPVIVEHICETLAEAKLKATKTGVDEKVGRGYRKIKPRDYFSPAEEEEKALQFRRKYFKKGSSYGTLSETDDYQKEFIKLLNPNIVEEVGENEPHVGQDKANQLRDVEKNLELLFQPTGGSKKTGDQVNRLPLSLSQITQSHGTVVSAVGEGSATMSSSSSSVSTVVSGSASMSSSSSSVSTVVSGSTASIEFTGTSAAIVADTDLGNVSLKLDLICNLISKLSIEVKQLNEKMDSAFPNKNIEDIDQLPLSLPLKTLPEIEKLEEFIKANEENKLKYVKFLKTIGGHDYKDYVLRICRSLFSNSLAETCSWLGRKQNFAIGHLEITNLAFGVVHQKMRCSRKEYEHAFSEWLRHAKQRRLREQRKN